MIGDISNGSYKEPINWPKVPHGTPSAGADVTIEPEVEGMAAARHDNAITIRAIFIPVALAICGVFGGMYIQGTRAEERMAVVQRDLEMNKTRVEILNNKVLVLETSAKFSEQLKEMNENLRVLIEMQKRR